MANATNYEVSGSHLDRLTALWLKTGTDWTYADSVAGLWAYNSTYGGEVSRLPGSVVSNTALLIGRAVPGCYNKVMNFRHIDPRDMRQGLSGGGAMDDQVWKTFFNTVSHELREHELEAEAEYRRLWMSDTGGLPIDVAPAIAASFDAEAKRLISLSLADLISRYCKVVPTQTSGPSTRTSKGRVFDRNPLVVAIALVRANFKCEVSGCMHQAFEGLDGLPYHEVHHIRPLSEGGDDTPDNVACICPAHHREIHFGKKGSKLNASLKELRKN